MNYSVTWKIIFPQKQIFRTWSGFWATHETFYLGYFLSFRLCKTWTFFFGGGRGLLTLREVLEWVMLIPSLSSGWVSPPQPLPPRSQSMGKSISSVPGILLSEPRIQNQWNKGRGWWPFIGDKVLSSLGGRGPCLQKVVWCPVPGTSG